jgi:hypothetical protein
MNAMREVLRIAGMAALAVVPAFVLAQRTVPEGVVKRPDGTVVAPAAEPNPGDRVEWWRRESDAVAVDRERNRLEAESARQQRVEQSRREREAALANPARQVAPTQNR